MGKIDDYFSSYPDAEALYETVDGQVFLEKGKAETHAQRLSKHSVFTHTRGKDEPVDEEAVKAEAAAEAKEKLLSLDFSEDAKAFEQPQLLALAKALGVVTPDNKKATLIAALLELQSQLVVNNN
jgi:hypothetical protein